MVQFTELKKITGGKLLRLAEDVAIKSLTVDSRKSTGQRAELFFAIKGIRHDGHNYLAKAYASGVRSFVLERAEAANILGDDSNVLLVDSSVEALQMLAQFHREKFKGKVIGITGSNGKTIVKEWLYYLLSKFSTVGKNPGSYNSQVGVPLSVWSMDPGNDYAILEAGISKSGEMQRLAKIIHPAFGIFTNIGPAHDEGFASTEDKIMEKLKLFATAEKLVYCYDHSLIREAVNRAGMVSFTWGVSPQADVPLVQEIDTYIIYYQDKVYSFVWPAADEASIQNIMHCITMMILLELPLEELNEQLRGLRPVPMRMELKEGLNGCQIINDSYNNDLAGLEIGLQFLVHQQQRKMKRIIVSDILQSGLPERELAERMALLINRYQILHCICIGPVLGRHKELFSPSTLFFPDTESFLDQFPFKELHNEVILVKGARTFQFEQIVRRLESRVHGTTLEINLGAIAQNLNYFRNCLKSSTKLMVMVKALAYGSGLGEVASLLQYHQVDYLGVAYIDEGIALRNQHIRIPIMVMNPTEDGLARMIAYDLEPEIYSLTILNSIVAAARGEKVRIHLKIDTGMHRLGFQVQELERLKEILGMHTNLEIVSVFTHLSASDEKAHDQFSADQIARFEYAYQYLFDIHKGHAMRHVLNSSGVLRFPEWQFEMVRVGIGLYGVDPTITEAARGKLTPAVTLKTIVSQIKEVDPGESIGYGRAEYVKRPARVATIAIGYADGYSRAFSKGKGKVLINGTRAEVIGNVCMDMTMIDVSDVEAHEGDEVQIFGLELPIQEVAAWIGTIPYELLTQINGRVRRVFISEGI